MLLVSDADDHNHHHDDDDDDAMGMGMGRLLSLVTSLTDILSHN